MASAKPVRRIAAAPPARPRPRENYEEAAALYGIPHWGKGFFHVSDEGDLVVRPTREAARGVALKQIVD
jgi:arginine decarboxylase-like protein